MWTKYNITILQIIKTDMGYYVWTDYGQIDRLVQTDSSNQ